MLIVDLRLSQGEHGAGLADRLQQLHGAFPVLVITGETSSQALRHANESGYSLLQKPIAPEVLRRTIVAVLSGV
jgi:FixJ family two-component response regulator